MPMTNQPKNRLIVYMPKLTNSSAQPAIASGQTSHAIGVRNGRGRLGCDFRSINTPSATTKNANNVPEFDMSASLSTGNIAAKSATATPVIIVTTCGVLKVG